MTDRVLDIINDYENHGKISYLERKYHSSRITLRNILKENGVYCKPKRIGSFFSNKILCQNIINDYNINKNLNNLSGKYNIPVHSIRNFLKKENIFELRHKDFQTRRKYNLDETFFDVVDSEEKAYFLGFFICRWY